MPVSTPTLGQMRMWLVARGEFSIKQVEKFPKRTVIQLVRADLPFKSDLDNIVCTEMKLMCLLLANARGQILTTRRRVVIWNVNQDRLSAMGINADALWRMGKGDKMQSNAASRFKMWACTMIRNNFPEALGVTWERKGPDGQLVWCDAVVFDPSAQHPFSELPGRT